MNLYTIGFTQKSAEQFFKLISDNKIELLLDIRLNNSSQLAGFSKGSDLVYFLKVICNCDYIHALEFAPTEKILNAYKKKEISWETYTEEYTTLINNRDVIKEFDKRFSRYNSICLLCSEPTHEKCHRGILASQIGKTFPEINVFHI
jgi:uncharacterized protein (DUF488 family)